MAEINYVDSATMKEAANKVLSWAQEWKEVFDAITVNIVNELDTQWDGQANDLFIQQWRDEIKLYNNMQALIEKFANYLKTAAEEYDSTETEVYGAVQQH